MASEIDNTYAGVMKYFTNKLKSGEPGLWDIYWRKQYVCGVNKESGDSEVKVWLVDIDPRIESGEGLVNKITKAYNEFGRDLEHMENVGLDMSKTREEYDKLVEVLG